MNNKLQIIIVFLSVIIVAGGFLVWNKVSNKINTKAYTQVSIPVRIKSSEQLENKTPEAEKKNVSLLFGGDAMFDRYIRQVAGRKGNDFIFEKLDPVLKDNDLNIVNLEGPITDNPSVSAGSEFGARENYFFTFDKGVAGTLKKHNINLVNLGNNHILNFKEEGAKQTESYLTQARVGYFGSSITNSESRIKSYELNGLKITFVNYNQFTYQGKEKALEDIRNSKTNSDLVILYAHWGKEYETEPLESVKTLAHEFVDTGADLIIGSHPHVVQRKEIYQGKTIYYSLGNFVFDQYFQRETKEGLAVKVIIDPETKAITFKEIPLILQNNGQTWPK
jgi:poly-gamma-glutamate synthesis protein (capsule biosynthesis protein)